MIEGLAPMVKIEVVVDAVDAEFVESLVRAEGATGFTAVEGLAGFGHGGRSQGRLVFNQRGGQSLVITVLPEDRVDGVVSGLRTFFETRPGVMFVSAAWVSRPEYFTAR